MQYGARRFSRTLHVGLSGADRRVNAEADAHRADCRQHLFVNVRVYRGHRDSHVSCRLARPARCLPGHSTGFFCSHSPFSRCSHEVAQLVFGPLSPQHRRSVFPPHRHLGPPPRSPHARPLRQARRAARLLGRLRHRQRLGIGAAGATDTHQRHQRHHDRLAAGLQLQPLHHQHLECADRQPLRLAVCDQGF